MKDLVAWGMLWIFGLSEGTQAMQLWWYFLELKKMI